MPAGRRGSPSPIRRTTAYSREDACPQVPAGRNTRKEISGRKAPERIFRSRTIMEKKLMENPKNRTELSTERLLLRPWRTDDAADLYAFARDERIGGAAGWPPHRNIGESEEVIRTVFAAEETYAVVPKEEGRPVGCIGLLRNGRSNIPTGPGEAEVGYWIGAPYWGRGLIPEALEELMRHAFEDLRLSALLCGACKENVRSLRVQQKCGFRYRHTETGRYNGLTRSRHDIRISAISREQWRARTAGAELRIRSAAETDLALIRRLAGEAFPETYRDILAPAQIDYMMEWMYSERSLRRQMREGHRFFIASSHGEPCGYLSVERQGPALFHLQKIYVPARFQGIGAGERLFRQAVQYIRSLSSGPCRMELNVNRNNRAVHFYERMGMHRLREGDFPIGSGFFMNDYIMGLDIGQPRKEEKQSET